MGAIPAGDSCAARTLGCGGGRWRSAPQATVFGGGINPHANITVKPDTIFL
ncbi:MAG: hypothetical protein JGK17_21275 [Microcoleus sp. PH2017_10_PVI_O_A]|nr:MULTISPECIES: hypothetical protein [unclassified Microcoleus]MCC3408069.1 hypothetical protein [Microcoleus sp. PH2017_10_PVI_O_A]MCC3480620.1 hypothetical protein [Microcoleus sp. PH2017_12_PCY_D_A]